MSGEPDDDKPATRAELHAVEKRLEGKIERLEVKSDSSVQRLDDKIDRLAVEVIKTQADVREIKESMATKDDVSRIMGAIDAFSKQSERGDRAMVLHGQALTEHGVKLQDHDRRIASLESSRS